MSIVFVSGGFDPCHEGHLDYLEGAAKWGKVIVLLNSDNWLTRKKGYTFQTWETRARIIRAMGYSAYDVDDTDNTVNKGLAAYAPLFTSAGQKVYFAKGGDRTAENTPEQEQCDWLGIEMLWNIGGGKTQSSSDLVLEAWKTRLSPTATCISMPFGVVMATE